MNIEKFVCEHCGFVWEEVVPDHEKEARQEGLRPSKYTSRCPRCITGGVLLKSLEEG